MSKKIKIEFTIYESYLAVLKNSIGSKLFRNLYFKIGGKKRDILENGTLSCAFFVSSLLYFFGLIKKTHTTVDSTVKDMEKSGWRKIRKPRIGCVLIWEALEFADSDVRRSHKHAGFYVGGNKAISNSSKRRGPREHHWTFGVKNNKPVRKIVAMFWHYKLGA